MRAAGFLLFTLISAENSRVLSLVSLDWRMKTLRQVMLTDVITLSLVLLLDSVASQADDVTRLQTAIPAETHTVPQHHTHTSCQVTHLQHRLELQRGDSYYWSCTGFDHLLLLYILSRGDKVTGLKYNL